MKLFETIKKLFWVARPISWPNTAYPFAIGYWLASLSTQSFDWATFIIATIYFLGPYNLLMYGVNDVYDYESDIKNPRKGGVEGMREARSLHPVILKAAIWTNAPFLLYLLAVSNWSARAVLVAVVFFVVAYSLKGLRFKEKPILDSITSSLHFVGPLLFALSLQGFPQAAWPFVIAFFAWGMASHAFGAVQDIIPDRKGKIASIATKLGARTTVWFSALLYAVAAVLVALQGAAYLPVALIALVYVLNVAPYLFVTDKTSASTNTSWKRFLWLNYCAGAIVTIVILSSQLYS